MGHFFLLLSRVALCSMFLEITVCGSVMLFGLARLCRASSNLEPAVSCPAQGGSPVPCSDADQPCFYQCFVLGQSSTATAPALTPLAKLFLLGETKAIKSKVLLMIRNADEQIKVIREF